MKRIALLLLLLPLFAQAQMNIITLKHRPAESLIPLLRPVLDEGVGISGTGATLIVNGTPAQLEEIRTLVRQIDTPLHSLLISVMQDGGDRRSEVHGNISGNLAQPDIRLSGRSNRGQEQVSQQLRVIEGEWATIRAGEAVPVVSQSITRSPYGSSSQRTVEYQNVESGFEVRPRISGQVVTLEVRPFHAKRTPGNSGTIEQQELHTTVSGRLGEWITLGGVDEQQQHSGVGTFYAGEGERHSRRSVRVKVEQLPN